MQRFIAAGKKGACVVGHHIGTTASLSMGDVETCVVLREGFGESKIHDAFLGIDKREGGIVREPVKWALFLSYIEGMMHATKTALLIAAEDNADAATKRQATLHERFRRVERGIGWAFIVRGAPRVDIAIFYFGAVGWVVPSISFRDNIEMP